MTIRRYSAANSGERAHVLVVLRIGLEEQAPYTGDPEYVRNTLARHEWLTMIHDLAAAS